MLKQDRMGIIKIFQVQFLLKTSKFDWKHDHIRTEKISRFLEQHGPHSSFNSSSFNYSMPKEGSSEVKG